MDYVGVMLIKKNTFIPANCVISVNVVKIPANDASDATHDYAVDVKYRQFENGAASNAITHTIIKQKTVYTTTNAKNAYLYAQNLFMRSHNIR